MPTNDDWSSHGDTPTDSGGTDRGEGNPASPEGLAARYRTIRARTCGLIDPLTPEDCTVQSMEDASPAKWHLAHTTWYFETFVLERGLPGYQVFHPAFRVLFNSYYNAVGEQHPRPKRGLLTRPGLDEVFAYREHVDRHMLDLLSRREGLSADQSAVFVLGLHHEEQHQELLLMDIKHLLSCNPLQPTYRRSPAPTTSALKPLAWHAGPAGVREIGHGDDGFAFDNETPRHRVYLDAYEIASRAITSGEFLAFMQDRGYERPELWLADGWSTAQAEGWRAPLYWDERDGEWWQMTLSGPREVHEHEPVVHVSYFEADAFARWFGARLPSEEEWEVCAAQEPAEGNFLEDAALHPRPVDPAAPTDAPTQLYGDVWEWTQSAYGSYPGYEPPPGAIGEYNGKFMCNQLSLRGGSCATPAAHIRHTYRNFFYPHQRWQFGGIRLARDLR